MNSVVAIDPVVTYTLLVVGMSASLWIIWKATKLGPLSNLAVGGLFFWGIGGLFYFIGTCFPEYSKLHNYLWVPLFLGYASFILLVGSLPRPSRFPIWLYALAIFPVGAYLMALPYTADKIPLTIIFALELVLFYYALPLWYALALGEAPEGRSIWIPVLIFFGAAVSVWFSMTPIHSNSSIVMGAFAWTAAQWLLVSGLELETNGRPVSLTHLSLVAVNFMTIWMLILNQWCLSSPSIPYPTWKTWLAGVASLVGPLSVFMPLYLFKRRSERNLARWGGILSQLTTFLWKQENPTPESIALEIYKLFKQGCDNVAGVRLAVFDDLTIGERTGFGITLRDRDLVLGRVYLYDHESCLRLLEAMAALASQRLREVIHTLDWRSKAQTDPLTGLLNRRGFKINVHYAVEQAKQNRWPITVAMLDIDHFKAVNDKIGHAAGDALLQKIADVLQKNLRDDDLAIRWGGEEFLVLVADSNLDQAEQVFERVRQRIGKVRVSGVDKTISVSVGMAGGRTPDSVKVIEEWIERADEALRRAKQNGRNRIEKDS